MCSCNDLKKIMWMLVRNCFAILFMNSSNITIFYENINIRFKKKNENENKCVCLSMFYLKTNQIKFSPFISKEEKNTWWFGGSVQNYTSWKWGLHYLWTCWNLSIWFSIAFIISKYTEQAENTLKNQIFLTPILPTLLFFGFLT